MSFKRTFYATLAASSALFLVAPAHAQSTAQLNAQIRNLQNQLKSLTQQLYDLQGQVVQTQRNQAVTNETVTQMKAAPAAVVAPPSGVVVSMPNNRPTISSADGQNSISLTGRIHWDVGDYVHYHAENPHGTAVTPTPSDLNSGQNFRRARLGILGKVLGDWNYALIYDFGGTQDSGSGGINAGGIETAEISYTGFRPFTIEGGAQDIPFTLDEATSSNDIMFIERASAQVIAANIAGGDFRSNFGGHWNNNRAWVGAYITGPQTGSIHTGIAQQIGATQRATYQLIQTDQASLHIGGNAEELIKPPISGAGGFRDLTVLSDRPELRIDPSTILNAGTLGTAANPVTGAQVYGLETAGGLGSLFGQAEYFHYSVQRSGLSDASFNGGYAQASYTVTGEHRKYNPNTGAYTSIVPTHPFDIHHFSEGAWGALELGARYSAMSLNSNYFPGALTGAGSNAVAGGLQQVITVGANWYINGNIRFMLNYLHGWIGKHNGGTFAATGLPTGAGTGANFDAIALRAQVAW